MKDEELELCERCQKLVEYTNLENICDDCVDDLESQYDDDEEEV